MCGPDDLQLGSRCLTLTVIPDDTDHDYYSAEGSNPDLIEPLCGTTLTGHPADRANGAGVDAEAPPDSRFFLASSAATRADFSC